jgi:hypothetical protein
MSGGFLRAIGIVDVFKAANDILHTGDISWRL